MAGPSYARAAQSEEDAETAASQDGIVPAPKVDQVAERIQQQNRLRLICALLTFMLGAGCVAAWTQRERLAAAGIWGDSFDTESWAFSSTLTSLNLVTLSDRGQFGNVFVIPLGPDEKIIKPNPKLGESRSVYQIGLGTLKMAASDSQGILCLWRKSLWWMRPYWITSSLSALPHETLLMLGKDDQDPDVYRLVLALILPDKDGFTTASFQSNSVNASTISLSSETGGHVALYAGKGLDPYALLAEGARFGSQMASPYQRIPDAKPASTLSRLPYFARHLGWCTWNAFYTDIDGSKLSAGVASLQGSHVPIRWMIVDDGWQHTTNDSRAVIMNRTLRHRQRLFKLDSCPEKFGADGDADIEQLSLRETIRQLKLPRDEGGGGINYVFAWHAMLGYWLGVDPDRDELNEKWRRPAATLYYPHFSKGIMKTIEGTDFSITLGVGVPDDAHRYLGDYYDYMLKAGFDGVKTDVQARTSPLRPFTTEKDDPTYRHRHQIGARMLESLSENVKKFLGGSSAEESATPVIHCMSHAPEHFYRIPYLFGPRLPLLRASDDFDPTKPDSHGLMIATTSFNSLLFGHLATPDWDMFQTVISDLDGLPGHVASIFHAMARSIAGGPVYVSDKPESTNSTLLSLVACKDGTLLPCSDVGRPVKSLLLRDPLVGSGPLLVFNTNGIPAGEVTSGVVGVFQLVDGKDETITVNALDIPEFQQSQYENIAFIALSSSSQTAWFLGDRSSQIEVATHGWLWSDVITFVPVMTVQLQKSDLFYDLIPLGILGMFNGAGGIIRSRLTAVSSKKARARLSIRGCGEFGLLVRLRNSGHEWDNLPSLVHAQIGHSSLDLTRVRLDNSDASPIRGLQRAGLELISFDVPCIDSGPLDERWISFDMESRRS